MRVLGVIPARGGSTRIPRKNLERVGHVPLVVLACLEALKAPLDACKMSTDDPATALTVRGAVPAMDIICRGIATAGDGPMAGVLFEALSRRRYDAVCCLQPTSPFRKWQDVAMCIAMLEMTKGANSVVSVDETTGERNGAVYVTRVSMLRDGVVYDEHSLRYPMPHERSIDINTPEDLQRAREMWARVHS